MDKIDDVMERLRGVSLARSIAAEDGYAARLEAGARRLDRLALAQSTTISVVVAAVMVIANPFPVAAPGGGGTLMTAPGGTVL